MGLFGGIKDALFGSKDKVETESKPTLTPEQQAASNVLSQYLTSSGSPGSQKGYTGDLVAPLSGLETLSLSALEERARQIATTGDPNIRAASEALMGILQSGPTDLENFIQTNVNDPLTKEFDRTRTATSARFADQFFGSNRKEMDARNFDDFMQTLAATQADVRLRGRDSDRNAILEAIGLAPDLASSQDQTLLDLLDAGSVPRENETARLLGEFEKFKELTGRKSDMAGLIAQYLGVPAMENITTVERGGSGLVGGLLQGGGKAFGQAAGTKLASLVF